LATAVSVGAVVSCTAIVKLSDVVLPAASVALAVMVWVPRPNVLSD
jgi:hypothetical protein